MISKELYNVWSYPGLKYNELRIQIVHFQMKKEMFNCY